MFLEAAGMTQKSSTEDRERSKRVSFVAELHPLAKNISCYTVNPTDIGLCSCCCSLADIRAEADKLVALKRQLRMLPNLELKDQGLHFERRVIFMPGPMSHLWLFQEQISNSESNNTYSDYTRHLDPGNNR